MSNSDISFGFDPEVFLVYKDTKNYDSFVGDEFVLSPAVLHKENGLEFLTEDPKHPLLVHNKRVGVIMDGVACEINSASPIKTGSELRVLLDEALELLYPISKRYDLEISIKPAVNFDYQKYYTDSAKQDTLLLQGLIFGCDADMDAYDQSFDCPTLDVSNHPYRYGGGHIHMSNVKSLGELENCRALTQLCAISAGNFSIANAYYPELEKLRGSYYGKAGKFRPQIYRGGARGVEYRTPSNNWINYSADKLDLFLDTFRIAVDWYYNKEVGKRVLAEYSDMTLHAIKTADKELSTNILNSLEIEV